MGHCSTCGRAATRAATESTHLTSEGIVRYRRCSCGTRWVELAEFVVAQRTELRPV
ncbi:hypothetical protein [Dactylosporangium matsuzakiense]|uniref:Uncharacterized protein n=1 Tax=Dactylosporangium matsuzakiense TaxID=53360 RepID=A0A9W6KP52_9ACTN|nr:hypothetical protein [Dactylosporangium matsuzakiense]UWZ47624.1 hypothetical protein Dmats_15190 [Dactylosporangium matsuzakiense]GLL05567.1 hypothetical protein GCM10017581_073140 [Dactylosporangium matsuzakiense]